MKLYGDVYYLWLAGDHQELAKSGSGWVRLEDSQDPKVQEFIDREFAAVDLFLFNLYKPPNTTTTSRTPGARPSSKGMQVVNEAREVPSIPHTVARVSPPYSSDSSTRGQTMMSAKPDCRFGATGSSPASGQCTRRQPRILPLGWAEALPLPFPSSCCPSCLNEQGNARRLCLHRGFKAVLHTTRRS